MYEYVCCRWTASTAKRSSAITASQSSIQPSTWRSKYVSKEVRMYTHASSRLFSWSTELLAFASRLFAPNILDHLLTTSAFHSNPFFLVNERSGRNLYTGIQQQQYSSSIYECCRWTASTAQPSTAHSPLHKAANQVRADHSTYQNKYMRTCMLRPICFPGAWSSWHLQVAYLHLKYWTIYLLHMSIIPIRSSSWASVAGETARYAKRLVLTYLGLAYFRGHAPHILLSALSP